MKIAIYSCNFGNYRDEFKLYDNNWFDKKIDYHLFTENDKIPINTTNLQGWIIHKTELLECDFMDKFRYTSKYVKFVLPKVLKEYDIIVYIDSKCVKNLNRLTYDKIFNLINNNSNYEVFNLKHPKRLTIQEELKLTICIGVENETSGNIFLQHVNNFVSKFDLPETNHIIRKNNENTNEAFKFCFELINKFKLKRDQNVYNFALDQKNITPLLINFLN